MYCIFKSWFRWIYWKSNELWNWCKRFCFKKCRWRNLIKSYKYSCKRKNICSGRTDYKFTWSSRHRWYITRKELEVANAMTIFNTNADLQVLFAEVAKEASEIFQKKTAELFYLFLIMDAESVNTTKQNTLDFQE